MHWMWQAAINHASCQACSAAMACTTAVSIHWKEPLVSCTWCALECTYKSASTERTHGVRVACNLLERGGDDEVGCVHGDQVCSELAAEVVLVVQLLPAAPQQRASAMHLLPQQCAYAALMPAR